MEAGGVFFFLFSFFFFFRFLFLREGKWKNYLFSMELKRVSVDQPWGPWGGGKRFLITSWVVGTDTFSVLESSRLRVSLHFLWWKALVVNALPEEYHFIISKLFPFFRWSWYLSVSWSRLGNQGHEYTVGFNSLWVYDKNFESEKRSPRVILRGVQPTSMNFA